ncbi:hypothetical protein BBJ28_00008514 [Nothophytophthora sp. Chile5]|nr:hypothetical protein BBJ28_00008514 [Nothophytophthora sp. Chile5]
MLEAPVHPRGATDTGYYMDGYCIIASHGYVGLLYPHSSIVGTRNRTKMHFVRRSQGGELSVRSTKLDGYPPVPTWNGTVDAPSEGTRGLCSVLSASGELVVLQAVDRGGGSAEGGDAAGIDSRWRLFPASLP